MTDVLRRALRSTVQGDGALIVPQVCPVRGAEELSVGQEHVELSTREASHHRPVVFRRATGCVSSRGAVSDLMRDADPRSRPWFMRGSWA